ncbi:MAG TPA: hypothetical protein VFJ82_24380 [Longimicrobium sp.]|nr:hypothetical protein [Longimicrobium sp.]
MRRIPLILAAAAALLAAPAALPTAAQAQCTWGCTCRDSACGCNSNGSGSSCVNGGNGCVVYKCGSEQGPLVLGADGSVVRVASLATASAAWSAPGPFAAVAVQSRWEYRSPGRSVARHCSGVVVARYFDRTAAAAVRRRQRTLTV